MDPLEVRLGGKLAVGYLAVASLDFDMKLVLALVDDLSKRPPPEDALHDEIRMGLWTAVVVIYGRCFGQGYRHPYAVGAIPKTRRLAILHRRLINHRNADIAHVGAENILEQATALASLAPVGSEPGIRGVGFEANRFVLPWPEQIEETRELVAAVSSTFRVHLYAHRARLLAAVRAYPIDKFYKTAARGGTVRINLDKPRVRTT